MTRGSKRDAHEPVWFTYEIKRAIVERRKFNKLKRNETNETKKKEYFEQYLQAKYKAQLMIKEAIEKYERKVAASSRRFVAQRKRGVPGRSLLGPKERAIIHHHQKTSRDPESPSEEIQQEATPPQESNKMKEKNVKKKTKKKKLNKEPEVETESDGDNLDLSVELYPLSHYVSDQEELVNHMFSTMKGTKLQAMLPPVLRAIPTKDLKRLCLHELRGMSKKRILCIITGQEMEGSSGSEEEEEEEEVAAAAAQQTHSGNEKVGEKRKSGGGAADFDINKKIKVEPGLEKAVGSDQGAKSVLELLELEMRARIIKTMLEKGDDGGKAAEDAIAAVMQSAKQITGVGDQSLDAVGNKEPITPDLIQRENIPENKQEGNSVNERGRRHRERQRNVSSRAGDSRKQSSRNHEKDRHREGRRTKEDSSSERYAPKKKKLTRKEFVERMKRAKKNRTYRQRKSSEDEENTKQVDEAECKEESKKKDNVEAKGTNEKEEEGAKRSAEGKGEGGEIGEVSEKEEGEIDSNEEEEGACSPSDISSVSYYSSSYSSRSRSRSYSRSVSRSTSRGKRRSRSRSRSYSRSVSKSPSRGRRRGRKMGRKRRDRSYCKSRSRSTERKGRQGRRLHSRSRSAERRNVGGWEQKRLHEKKIKDEPRGDQARKKEGARHNDKSGDGLQNKEEEENWGQRCDIEFVVSDEDFDDNVTTSQSKKPISKHPGERASISFSLHKKSAPQITKNIDLDDLPLKKSQMIVPVPEADIVNVVPVTKAHASEEIVISSDSESEPAESIESAPNKGKNAVIGKEKQVAAVQKEQTVSSETKKGKQNSNSIPKDGAGSQFSKDQAPVSEKINENEDSKTCDDGPANAEEQKEEDVAARGGVTSEIAAKVNDDIDICSGDDKAEEVGCEITDGKESQEFQGGGIGVDSSDMQRDVSALTSNIIDEESKGTVNQNALEWPTVPTAWTEKTDKGVITITESSKMEVTTEYLTVQSVSTTSDNNKTESSLTTDQMNSEPLGITETYEPELPTGTDENTSGPHVELEGECRHSEEEHQKVVTEAKDTSVKIFVDDREEESNETHEHAIGEENEIENNSHHQETPLPSEAEAQEANTEQDTGDGEAQHLDGNARNMSDDENTGLVMEEDEEGGESIRDVQEISEQAVNKGQKVEEKICAEEKMGASVTVEPDDFYRGAEDLTFSEEEPVVEPDIEEFIRDKTPVEPIRIDTGLIRKSVVKRQKMEIVPPEKSWTKKLKKKKEKSADALAMEGLGHLRSTLMESRQSSSSDSEATRLDERTRKETPPRDQLQPLEEEESTGDDSRALNSGSREDDQGDDEEQRNVGQETEIIGVIETSQDAAQLDDTDLERSSWSMRWLQSEKVQKVVTSSKMLSRMRKKIQKDKATKVVPVEKTEETQKPAEPSLPIIGSIEEYERLFGMKAKKEEGEPSTTQALEESSTATIPQAPEPKEAPIFGSDDEGEDSEEEALWSKILKK